MFSTESNPSKLHPKGHNPIGRGIPTLELSLKYMQFRLGHLIPVRNKSAQIRQPGLTIQTRTLHCL
jgi:hypothetical protein